MAIQKKDGGAVDEVKKHLILIIVLFIASCAQVPKESVKLSAAVGRDLSEMRKAHQELVVLYYDRVLKDINNFVYDIYAPYQIQKTLNQHKDTIISAIESASKPDSTGEKQKECLAILGVYLEEIRILHSNDAINYASEILEFVRSQMA